MSRALFLSLLVASATAMLAVPKAQAQDLRLMAYGFRSGLVLDDDLFQLLIGGQADLGRLDDNVRLQPFLTLGIGDDALTMLVAGEVHYLFPVEADYRFLPYAGGGIGLHHVDFDDDGEDTEVALLLAAGADVPVQRWWGYFVEGRFVIEDDALFRLEAGVNWQY